MKAVVLGYHEIGYVCLEALLESRISVSALFTHKDDPEEEIWFRTPRALAEENGIPVFDPESLADPAWAARIRAYEPDYLFSFYYRHMLPKEVLDIPKIAPLNLHGSLLPKFRGRCPVNWVLVEGEQRTGVTLHVMEVKPDAGDIVGQREVPIAFEDTAESLARKLASAAAGLMREVMPQLGGGQAGTKAPDGSIFILRRPQAGRRYNRLGKKRIERLQPRKGGHPPLPRRLHVYGRPQALYMEGSAAGRGSRRAPRYGRLYGPACHQGGGRPAARHVAPGGRRRRDGSGLFRPPPRT